MVTENAAYHWGMEGSAWSPPLATRGGGGGCILLYRTIAWKMLQCSGGHSEDSSHIYTYIYLYCVFGNGSSSDETKQKLCFKNECVMSYIYI